VDAIVGALGDQQAELSALLDGLDEDGWAQPSPCEGWDVADVVLHLCQTNEMALASAEERLGAWYETAASGAAPAANVDDAAASFVAAERGRPVAELLARWHQGADALRAALAAGDPHLRVDWVVGRLSLRTLATTRLAETWIHTGDVATALGRPLLPTARLEHIARLAWRTLPYAFSRSGRELHGPVAFVLDGPDGATWPFVPEEPASTTVRGDALELCLVAARRVDPAATALTAEGPDADAVLELVRTYA
jgi:uncharacterized protein (TIGR03084 family)